MRRAQPLERAVGIESYVSDADGTGGRLRASEEDFRVREIEAFDTEPETADRGSYPYLVIRATLAGWETNRFASSLSSALGIARDRVAWAGTKDANAVTTQLFTVRDIDADALPTMSNAELEVVGRAGRAIEFGDLAGNEFELLVRDAEAPSNARRVREELAAFGAAEGSGGSCDSDSPDADDIEIGVPNLFGNQRFGSRRAVTHEVGLSIVREQWEEAVLNYVGNPSEHEPEESRAVRNRIEETRDWQAATEWLPRRLDHERTLVSSLAGSDTTGPEQFREALETLPWTLRRLFVNAAQSYAFNRILSERLQRGLPFERAVAGDVVCFAEQQNRRTLPDPSRTQRVSADRVSTVNRHCERGRAFVTAPLIGTETELGSGAPGEIESDVFEALDLEPASFDLPEAFHSTGTRRAILVRTDCSLGFDPLTLEFELPAGSYATVVSREVLKVSPLQL